VNSSTDYQRSGASIGIGWWSSSRFELQFSLDISTVKRADGAGSALTTAVGTMKVVLRAPERHHVVRPDAAPPAWRMPAAQAPPPPVPVEAAPPLETSPSGGTTPPVEPVLPVEIPSPAPAPPADSSPQDVSINGPVLKISKGRAAARPSSAK